jgi:hypothetical protein
MAFLFYFLFSFYLLILTLQSASFLLWSIRFKSALWDSGEELWFIDTRFLSPFSIKHTANFRLRPSFASLIGYLEDTMQSHFLTEQKDVSIPFLWRGNVIFDSCFQPEVLVPLRVCEEILRVRENISIKRKHRNSLSLELALILTLNDDSSPNWGAGMPKISCHLIDTPESN